MKERGLFALALASFLPPEVAEMVESSPSDSPSVRRSRRPSSSPTSEASLPWPNASRREVADVVGRHLAAMADVVAAHGGTLDKFAGDAVMAVFGVPGGSKTMRSARFDARSPCSIARAP
jgi:adenylate cyclase